MSHLHKNKEYYLNDKWTVGKVREEIDSGLKILNKYDEKFLTFFGSHLIDSNDPYYIHCNNVSYKLGKLGYAIISGGGPGIMHAANSGAKRAGAVSIGFKASLLTKEKITDPIFSEELSFHFLFARRFIMSIKSEALVFYPGGFGTLNELFEYAVLMQTGIVDRVPIICVNKKFWNGLFDWISKKPLKENLFSKKEDLSLIKFADSFEDILSFIEKGK